MRLLPLLLAVLFLPSFHAVADDSGLPQTTLFYSTVSGIGAGFREVDGHVVVHDLVDDSPAKRAGVKPGDRVVKVDGKSVAGESVSQVISRVRGPDGTIVNLVVDRDGSERSFAIKRELIRIRRANSAVNPQH
jgi:carboxyl-terminal processing protease